MGKQIQLSPGGEKHLGKAMGSRESMVSCALCSSPVSYAHGKLKFGILTMEESVSGVGPGTVRLSSLNTEFSTCTRCCTGWEFTDLGLEELGLGWVPHSLTHTYCSSENRAFPGKQLSLCGEFCRSSHTEMCSASPGEGEVTKPEASKEMMLRASWSPH